MSPRIYSNTIYSSIGETLTLSSIMKVKWEDEQTVSVNRWVMHCCDVYSSIYHCLALLMCYVQGHSRWCNFLWNMKSENHAKLKGSTQYRMGNISELFYYWTEQEIFVYFSLVCMSKCLLFPLILASFGIWCCIV